jgi:hypothetical protein
MLSIGKLGKGQERYYLDKVAEGAEDYYTGEGKDPGEWIGEAAKKLGLEGEVEAAQLETMLTGRNPVDGEPLLGMRGVRVVVVAVGGCVFAGCRALVGGLWLSWAPAAPSSGPPRSR